MSRDAATGPRTIEERAGLRWPSVLPRITRSVLRLPAGSRMRSAMLRRWARMAFEVWHREDFAVVPHIDDPAVETHMTHGSSVPVGMDPTYYGPVGHCRAMEAWNEAWREWSADIDQVIDVGRDQFVVVAGFYGEAAASGIQFSEWGAVRYTFREGRIVRIDGALHPERRGALEAVGLQG